jgi:hypothetical protein
MAAGDRLSICAKLQSLGLLVQEERNQHKLPPGEIPYGLLRKGLTFVDYIQSSKPSDASCFAKHIITLTKILENGRAIGRAQASAGIPTRVCVIITVVAGGDILQRFGRGQFGVEFRVQPANPFAEPFVEKRNQRGPERRYGAGSTYNALLDLL